MQGRLARMVMRHLPGTAQSSLPPAPKPHSLFCNHQGFLQVLLPAYLLLLPNTMSFRQHSSQLSCATSLHTPWDTVCCRNAKSKSCSLASHPLQHHLWVKTSPGSLVPSSDFRSGLGMARAEIAPRRNLSHWQLPVEPKEDLYTTTAASANPWL